MVSSAILCVAQVWPVVWSMEVTYDLHLTLDLVLLGMALLYSALRLRW